MRPRALIFDVFGTLVDWRASIARAATIVPAEQREAFADAWRARYQPAMARVRDGARPFVPLDVLHRENLDRVLCDFAIEADEATRAALNLVWHRLDAWPDVGDGLHALRQQALLAPHSNGNLRLLIDLARHNGWTWDAILGAEVTGYYKPRPESYRRAAALLALAPHEVMMVAAHNADLAAARDCGLATAFIGRPFEHGPTQTIDLSPTDDWDVVADDLPALARRLRAAG